MDVDPVRRQRTRGPTSVRDPQGSRDDSAAPFFEEPLSADPDDEYLLDLARAAAADVLVSGDSHLLVLRDVVPVMTPAEFLAGLANP